MITDRGLVGWVSAVYPTYSHVTTILSPETNVSVLDQVTQDTGVVAGSLEYAAAGQVEMRFLTAENKLKAGDIIVTSGVGAFTPESCRWARLWKKGRRKTPIPLRR